MPEFIDAFEQDGHYFAVIGINKETAAKRFKFGISRIGYLALKKAMYIRPFDMMPGLQYRYFYAGSCRHLGRDQYVMDVRIELNRDATKRQSEIPKDLHAYLLWFSRLKNLEDAAYLELKSNNSIHEQ